MSNPTALITWGHSHPHQISFHSLLPGLPNCKFPSREHSFLNQRARWIFPKGKSGLVASHRKVFSRVPSVPVQNPPQVGSFLKHASLLQPFLWPLRFIVDAIDYDPLWNSHCWSSEAQRSCLYNMTKWPKLNFRKQLLYESMILNQTHYLKQICFRFCFLGLCRLPSETTMKVDIVERNEKKIDL